MSRHQLFPQTITLDEFFHEFTPQGSSKPSQALVLGLFQSAEPPEGTAGKRCSKCHNWLGSGHACARACPTYNTCPTAFLKGSLVQRLSHSTGHDEEFKEFAKCAKEKFEAWKTSPEGCLLAHNVNGQEVASRAVEEALRGSGVDIDSESLDDPAPAAPAVPAVPVMQVILSKTSLTLHRHLHLRLHLHLHLHLHLRLHLHLHLHLRLRLRLKFFSKMLEICV